MFDAIAKGFRSAKQRLSGLTELTEENLEQILREVRLSLLEADVELSVTKAFIDTVKSQALGRIVKTQVEKQGKRIKVGPGEQFIAICQKELESLMKAEGPPIVFEPKPKITGIMMVGLQGSGKTTTSAKLARWLEKKGRKPLLVAADIQRPGAIEQLQILGERLNIPVFAIPGGRPTDICEQALDHAKKLKRDTIIFDTAGRLAVDEALMQELSEIRALTKPTNTLLVIDAMMGQDSVRTARAFHDRLELTGVALTKIDGDARGGAALSVRQVTGVPIRFAGMGESIERLEEFRAEGMASRILGFGDITSLMRDFEEVVDEKKAEKDARRMLQGQFTLDDFLEQLSMVQKMGPLKDIMEKLPMMAEQMPAGMSIDEREIERVKATVFSMTRAERQRPEIFANEPTRIRRVAKGSGRNEQDVVELLKRFAMMKQMMGSIGQHAGMLSKIPGMKQLAMARKLKDSVRLEGLGDNPLMGNFADGLLEAAVAGNGMGLNAAMAKPTSAEKNRKKSQRKAQKKARKKSRK